MYCIYTLKGKVARNEQKDVALGLLDYPCTALAKVRFPDEQLKGVCSTRAPPSPGAPVVEYRAPASWLEPSRCRAVAQLAHAPPPSACKPVIGQCVRCASACVCLNVTRCLDNEARSSQQLECNPIVTNFCTVRCLFSKVDRHWNADTGFDMLSFVKDAL